MRYNGLAGMRRGMSPGTIAVGLIAAALLFAACSPAGAPSASAPAASQPAASGPAGARPRYSAESSLVIAATELLASPNSIAVLGS